MLFLSSYVPLFVLISIRSVGDSDLIAAATGILAVAGVVATIVFLDAARRKQSARYQLAEVESRDGDVAAYAATYLLPFLTVFGGNWKDIVSLVIFIGVLGFVYVRSRLIYVNPMLALLGYRLWRVIPVTEGSSGSRPTWPRFLLAKTQKIHQDQVISACRVTDDLLLLDSAFEADDEPRTGATAD